MKLPGVGVASVWPVIWDIEVGGGAAEPSARVVSSAGIKLSGVVMASV